MIDDFQLRQSVLNELHWDTHFDATNVSVTTNSGAVTLSGHVKSFSELFGVREAVRRIHGVMAIADEMQVQLPSDCVQDDTEVAKSIAQMLQINVISNRHSIKPLVRKGVVTLTGEVEWHSERSQIESLVTHIQGVKKINNQIILKKKLTPDDVKQQINDALERNAKLEASRVNITVNNDEVTLTGTVKAFYERNLVEAAAWNAPGVHKVVDKIKVGSQ